MNDGHQERRDRAEGASALAGRRPSSTRRAGRGNSSFENALLGAAMAVAGTVITLMIWRATAA